MFDFSITPVALVVIVFFVVVFLIFAKFVNAVTERKEMEALHLHQQAMADKGLTERLVVIKPTADSGLRTEKVWVTKDYTDVAVIEVDPNPN